MGVFYGDKIYGVRWGSFNVDIERYESLKVIFELKFQLLTTAHMNTIKDAFQKVEEQEQEPNNIIEYYFQRIMQTTHEWCSNSDEVVYFVWVKCTKEDMERFIQQNEKNIL
jgi:hypothetical protein